MCGAFLRGGHGDKPHRLPEGRIAKTGGHDGQTTLIERRNNEDDVYRNLKTTGYSGYNGYRPRQPAP